LQAAKVRAWARIKPLSSSRAGLCYRGHWKLQDY
jgi:hypothetical protein